MLKQLSRKKSVGRATGAAMFTRMRLPRESEEYGFFKLRLCPPPLVSEILGASHVEQFDGRGQRYGLRVSSPTIYLAHRQRTAEEEAHED